MIRSRGGEKFCGDTGEDEVDPSIPVTPITRLNQQINWLAIYAEFKGSSDPVEKSLADLVEPDNDYEFKDDKPEELKKELTLELRILLSSHLESNDLKTAFFKII